MKLRFHPKMKGQWPPAHPGGPYDPKGQTFLTGEEGVLKDVKHDPGANSFTCEIEFQGQLHSWFVRQEDADFLDRLCKNLSSCIGWLMTQIGDLEIDD